MGADTEERKLRFLYDDDENEQNKTKLVFKMFRRILAGLILFILVLLLIFNYDKLNTDNFRRAFAKIDFSLNKSSGTKNHITFARDQQNILVKYKDGLALVSSDSIKVYDSTDRKSTRLNSSH